MSARRKTRSGGGATNRSNEVPVETPRVRSSAPLRPEQVPEGDVAPYTPRRALGESYQESNTHDSWRGFPKREKSTRSSRGGMPKEDADWKTAVRVGQKIDQDRRKDLLAKAEKMAVRMRQSFLEIDTSGDSRLDPDETLAMFEQSEAALSSDEIDTLQTFMWAGDVNGDREISYGEFVDRFHDFIAELRPGNVKAESHKAMAALAKSDLMTRLFKHKDDFLQRLAKVSTHSMRMVDPQELRSALEGMKKLKLSDDEIEWITLAANTYGRERFDAVALIEAAAVKRGVDLDIANRNFKRAVALDVEETKLDDKTLEEFRLRAQGLQKKVGPLIHELMGKISAKTGDSLQRAFRALDIDKSGVLDTDNLIQGFKLFQMDITEEQAQDIVGACDVNQDGHVAFTDFQQFFLQTNQPYATLDHTRQIDARTKGVPSQILRDWAASKTGGAGQPAWFSQFHQGDWQGPFKGHPQMSACKLDESARFQKPFAPQYVDEHVLKRMCKEGKAGANAECSSLDSNARGLSPVQVPEPSLDFERSRAAKLVKQACLTRKQENLNRVHDQIREREEKMMMRDKAKVENSILNREDWMQRCRAAYLSIGNKHGKGYREPEVRHAFYAPTKLHYYEHNQYPQFDRALPSGAHPSVG